MAQHKKLSVDGYGRTYVRKKKVPGQPGTWPEKKKLEVVTTLLSTGSPSITSAMTNVPVETIHWWKRQEWWKEMEDQVRNSEDLELSAKLKKIVDKSLEAVVDRLEEGDFQYDPRTGKLIRVPVKLREAQKALNDSIDKRMLLQKRPTKITEHQATVDDRLKGLAEQFAQFVKGKQEILVNEVIEGDEFITEVIEKQEDTEQKQ